jgi:purine-cytosine permease-like protein
MVPFFSLSFYIGPVTRALGGADLSFVVGQIVSGAAYLTLCRRRTTQSIPTDSHAAAQVAAS